ncbi:response regulator receiver domain-containing protein [Prosthecobacter fusiformis]|uniref:histidine kinase n=1 Tax=Prosthecobacter fusiformis TaxID=48464 RepID=A0A4V3FG25_9BACT|nr:response regulator [Prosthecobacter fusiformis]TDU73033.1 response regulator receiver domain-containing protein [Prosthecobacter fusiformis]
MKLSLTMQLTQPTAKTASKYQVLIASASEDTLRLLEPLQHIPYPDGQADSGGLFRPKQRMLFHPLDYNLVDMVMRSRELEWPFALVIVDVQPGAETKAEQILNALYYAEPALGIIVLLSDGATLSQAMLDLITHSARLTFVEMPGSIAQIYQPLKMMLSMWEIRQRLADAEAAQQRSEESAMIGRGGPPSAAEGTAPAMHLEVVGSLAAGISHEFNNVLTVIQSQMDMAIQQAGSLPGVVQLLNQVMETARSASTLSRKLVSFTPDEESTPEAVNLALALDEEVMLLSKTLGDHIRVEVAHGPQMPAVWADPSIISQVIINVALHARNAMTEGGTLQISTARIQHETGGKYARLFPEAAHGEYVMLTMEDPNPSDNSTSGDPGRVVVALPSSVQRAADDRLLWIQRTIQSAGGAFNVTLLPGMIRTYQILFPLAKDQEVPAPEAEASRALALAGDMEAANPATVLVVDDDDTICMIMSQVLATKKHRVLTAKSADEAWQQWCQHRSTIKLLITDINMPGGANGVTLGHAIQEQDGSVPVIYTSGHRAVHQFAELEIGNNYLPKPFGMNDLLAVANRALLAHGHHGLS